MIFKIIRNNNENSIDKKKDAIVEKKLDLESIIIKYLKKSKSKF
jgi:hypothetical protein